MQLHEQIRQAMKGNERKIELFQWATISGVAALIYSEYIRRIQRKTFPTPRADVPTIHSVQQLLDSNSQLCDMLSRDMIDRMVEHPLMQRFSSIPELVLFRQESIEVLKCIFDAYIIPKLSTAISGSIAKKFNLQNDKQQEIVQNREIDMFDRQPFTDEHLKFIADETALVLLMLAPSISKESDNPTSMQDITLRKNDIIMINNINALAPIYLDNSMLANDSKVLDLIKFVTSTTACGVAKLPQDEDNRSRENEDLPYWTLSTSPFNEVLVTTCMSIGVAPPPDTETNVKE